MAPERMVAIGLATFCPARVGAEPWDGDPRIQALAALDTNVVQGDTIDVWATAIDLETKTLLYDWEVTGGEVVADDKDNRDGSGASKQSATANDHFLLPAPIIFMLI